MSIRLSASFRSLLLGATCSLLSASIAVADKPAAASAADPARIDGAGAQAVERLARLRPDIPVVRVSASPLPGIVALEVSGGTILYATEDGRYLFAGDLYELTETDLVNVAEAGRVDERREALASIDPASMIIFPATGVRRASINVFTDVDCGYCRKLQAEFDRKGVRYHAIDVDTEAGARAMAALNARGIPVLVVGRTPVHGYDETRTRELLAPLGYRVF